jgi:6-phosphogluconolactonase (cycloisomerase 2 family)
MKAIKWVSFILVVAVAMVVSGCYSVAFDPSGSYAYIMDQSNKLIVYQIDTNPSDLTYGFPSILHEYLAGSAQQPVASSTLNDWNMVVDPSGRYLYLELTFKGTPTPTPTIVEYSINQSDHSLALLPSAVTWTGTLPNLDGIAMDPLGRFVFVANASATGGAGVYSYSINPATGQLTLNGTGVFPTGGSTKQPKVDPSGRFLYATTGAVNGNVVALPINNDGTLGTAKTLTLPGSTNTAGLAVDKTGSFLAITDDGASTGEFYMVSVNRQTGALALLAGPVSTGGGSGTKAVAPAFDASNQFLYVVSNNASNGNTILTYGFNPSTGSLSQVPLTSSNIVSQTSYRLYFALPTSALM